MIPPHIYYQLAVVGLLWLCVMLHYVWPSQGAVSPQPQAEPVPPQRKRKRASEPTPFAGLTQRPHCAACEGDAAHPKPLPPRRPEPRSATNRRPRVSTPPCISARMKAVITEAGWDLATGAPMAIPVAAHGGSCSVRPVTVTF